MADTEENTNGPDLGITVPEDLTALTEPELAKLADKAAAAFDKLNGRDSVNADDLARLAALADLLDAVDTEAAGRAEAQAALQAERETLAARVAARQQAAAEDEDAEETPEGDTEEPAEAPAEVEAPVADAPAPVEVPTVEEVVAPEAVTEDDDEDEETPEDADQAPEAIAASANTQKGTSAVTRNVPRSVPVKATQVAPPTYAGLSIVASSDVPGVPSGSSLDRESLAEAMRKRARSMGDSKGNAHQALVASFSMETPKHDFSDITDDSVLTEAWAKATDPAALVASGGWCAPSETIYDFVCDFEALDGLVDLPTVTTTRGGIRYPVDNPTLRDVFNGFPANGSGFTWTEDDDIAAAQPGGPTKPCFTIPCPDFDETRLQAQGICVTAGNLTDRAYPELTNRYVDLVMAAHAHRMNALTLAKMEAGSTALPAFAPFGGAGEALLAAIELQITWIRDVWFMSEDFRLEVILPRHSRAIIRRDLARRAGVEFQQVTNQQIASFFDEIGANVQFVTGWHQITTENLVVWPSEVDFMIYPAGTHSKMTGGSIDLGVVRDSTLNATNDYTAAWTEEFWNVLTRGCVSLVGKVPVCPDGTTGAPVDITCPSL